MSILEAESREVNLKFKGICPLCRRNATFTVEKRKLDMPRFICPNCKAEWEYWEDWENPGMKGARLAKPGVNGEGREHLKGFLEVSYWQQLVEGVQPVGADVTVEEKPPVKPVEKPPAEEKKKKEEPLQPLQYSPYSLHNFKLEYPSDCKVVPGRRNSWSEGELDFQSPAGFSVKVMWGLLDRVKNIYPTPAELADTHITNIRKMRKVEDLAIIEQKPVDVQGHKGIFNNIKITSRESALFQKRKTQQTNLFLHVYCDKTQRYFILIHIPPKNEQAKQQEIFDNIIKSFNCHIS